MTVQFALPNEEPDVEVLDTLRCCNPEYDKRYVRPFRIRVHSVRHVARATLRYRPLGGSTLGPPYRSARAVKRVDTTTFRALMTPNIDLRNPDTGLPTVVDSATVTVVAAGPAWPGEDLHVHQLGELTAPTRDSTVRQGVGLVVGTSRKEVSVPVKVPEILPNGDLDIPPCPDSPRER